MGKNLKKERVIMRWNRELLSHNVFYLWIFLDDIKQRHTISNFRQE